MWWDSESGFTDLACPFPLPRRGLGGEGEPEASAIRTLQSGKGGASVAGFQGETMWES